MNFIISTYQCRTGMPLVSSVQQPECKPPIIRVSFGCNGISCTDDSLLHTLPGTVLHVAFKVSCLDEATVGEAVIPGPYEANDDYRVAIDDDGVSVELIETTLSDEECSIRAGESVLKSRSARG